MGSNRELLNNETSYSSPSSSSSLSEALIFATMCIIGLPVDVHVKDGSVYSGLFHTACVEDEYGIVLKNASMTKKGRSCSNVPDGVVIDTLVVLSADLVQVVAKGVQLSADGVDGNIAGAHAEAVVGILPSENLVREANKSTKSAIHEKKINQTRSSVQAENGISHGFMPKIPAKKYEARKLPLNQTVNAVEVEDCKRDGISAANVEEASGVSHGRSQCEPDIYKERTEFHGEESVDEGHGSTSRLDTRPTELKPVDDGHAKMTSQLLPTEASCDPATPPFKPDNQCYERPSSAGTSSSDTASSGLSTFSKPNVVISSDSSLSSLTTSSEKVPQQNSESNRSSKEFKLNPGAKIFSPSLVSPISATTAVPTVPSMTYVPNSSPMVPVASQPEIQFSPFASRSSMPVKFLPHANLTAGNGGSGSQFSQHIVGPMGSRTQPLRYPGQYNHVQAGPAYIHPNAQAVMVGRLGQLVYVHPVSHDLLQGAVAISPVAARPLLTPHPGQFPKQQGSVASQGLHLSAPPPSMVSGQQPFAVPNHMPLLQPPFPANSPISVPGANGLYSTKFS